MLPQWRQRTRRFFHRTPPYPVVYRIASTKAGVDLRFHLLLGPTQWDAVHLRYQKDSTRAEPSRTQAGLPTKLSLKLPRPYNGSMAKEHYYGGQAVLEG